jgi:hypothetical protein
MRYARSWQLKSFNLKSRALYPAIDPVEVNFDEYSTIFIGAPLWWSNMAAPLQTFYFRT